MSDRMSAEIRIGGPVKRKDLAEFLSEVEDSGGGLEWGEQFSPKDEKELLKAVKDDELRLVDDEAASGEFSSLEDFLKQHKIPFTRQTDGKYEYDPEVVHYRSGHEPEILSFITGKDGQRTMFEEDVRKIEKLLTKRGTVGADEAVLLINKLLPPVPPLSAFRIED